MKIMLTPLSERRGLGAALILVGLVGGGTTIVGGPIVLIWALAILAGTLGMARRMGWSLAFATATGGFLVLEFLVLRLNAVLGIGLPLGDVVVWTTLVCLVGLSAVVRPAAFVLPRGRDLALGLWASTGAIVVVATTALAQVLPGSLRLAWAMNGDFVNGMVFARRMLADGGIDPLSTPQPTALPFAMMAANMAPGRASLEDAAVLENDVARAAQLWVFVIALSCLLAGIIVARTVRPLRLAYAASVTVIASCCGLTWYVIGVQFQFGFINSSFAIAVMLAAWLAYLAGERHPIGSLGALFLIATAVLAVWSPLVVCVAGLGLVLIVRSVRSLFARPRLRLVTLALPFAMFISYAIANTIPGLIAGSAFLGADGGFPAIGPASIFVISSVTAVIACFVWALPGRSHAAAGAIGFLATFAVGLAYLLLQRGDALNAWGYYPAKFAWTASIILIVITIGLAGSLLVRFPPRARRDFAVVAAALALLGSLLWAPGTSPRPVAQLPLVGILQGNAFGLDNRLSDAVFALSGRANGQDILWRSSLGDFWPDFWLLQIDVDAPDGNPVRSYAHETTQLTAVQVCEVVSLLGEDVVVHTSDPNAQAELAATCQGDYRVLVDGY